MIDLINAIAVFLIAGLVVIIVIDALSLLVRVLRGLD